MLLSHGALHAGYQVYSSHGWFLSRIIELFYFHTEHRGRSRGFVTNYRIVEFLFTRRIAEGHGLFTRVFFLSRIIEFANWFRHAEGHGISRMVFVPRLVLGPTDQREVICELVFFTRNVTDGCGGYGGGTIEA